MALLDPERRCIVLRAIYDGPAFAGKTTSLRALAQSLGSKICTGEEAGGRTLYFDWVDYVGGMFEGMPIRCQIVGVPGQRILEGRRRLLLETADVVVFVADSTPQQRVENVHSFDVLRRVIAPMTPPVGIVVQANKRDVENATTLDALREALGGDTSLAMTESVAERGDGVRETFVLAVRLALDRVRELSRRNALPRLRPGIDDADQLFSAVKAAEKGNRASLSPLGLGGTDRRSPIDIAAPPPKTAPSSRAAGPPLPEASIPPGLVWPPVEGRIVVHEAARTATRLERHSSGDWISFSRDWKLRSPLEGLFFDLEEARAALLAWARWHAAVESRLSTPRCLVLVPEGGDVWRLWQIVRRVRTLRDSGRALFAQSDNALFGEGLFQIIDLRLQAEKAFVASGWLGRLELESVAASDDGEVRFAGFCPYPGSSSRLAPKELGEDRLIREELGPLVRRELRLAPRRIPAVLASLQRAAAASNRRNVAESIQQILMGS